MCVIVRSTGYLKPFRSTHPFKLLMAILRPNHCAHTAAVSILFMIYSKTLKVALLRRSPLRQSRGNLERRSSEPAPFNDTVAGATAACDSRAGALRVAVTREDAEPRSDFENPKVLKVLADTHPLR